MSKAMDDLYWHRTLLYALVCQQFKATAWRARKHHDGTGDEGWFIAGIRLPHDIGQISYHQPDRAWELFDGIATYESAPYEWDGHTSDDVVERLERLLLGG